MGKFHNYFRILLLLTIAAIPAILKADPPSRVARINYLSGTVSLQENDAAQEWVTAEINYPLTTGHHLWADSNSQVEMHVGSTAIRLTQLTEISFINLDDKTTQLRLPEGSINISIRNLHKWETFEIDTPNASISLTKPGDYRIDVSKLGSTIVTTRVGRAEVTTSSSTINVASKQRFAIVGNNSPIRDVITNDEFDKWTSERNRREDQVITTRYVSRELIGYEDLDYYGRWSNLAGYGNVWCPSYVPTGWSPYSYGRWIWTITWGWTWLDSSPWGFAPYHYGRWLCTGGRWYWWPGSSYFRPIYSPALVSFIGFGGGGPIGWFPLGPYEPYSPWYRCSSSYINSINLARVRNVRITNTNFSNIKYINRANGVVTVSEKDFTSSKPVHKSLITVPPEVIAKAPVTTGVKFTARKETLLTTKADPNIKVAKPPAYIQKRAIVVSNPTSPILSEPSITIVKKAPEKPVETTTSPSAGKQSNTKFHAVKEIPIFNKPESNDIKSPDKGTRSNPIERTPKQYPSFSPTAPERIVKEAPEKPKESGTSGEKQSPTRFYRVREVPPIITRPESNTHRNNDNGGGRFNSVERNPKQYPSTPSETRPTRQLESRPHIQQGRDSTQSQPQTQRMRKGKL